MRMCAFMGYRLVIRSMPKKRAEYVYIHHIIFRYIGYVIVQRPESKLNYKYEVVTI